MIEKKLRAFYHRIYRSVELPEGGLPYFRVFFGFFNLIFLPYFNWIGEVPGSFFTPPIWSLANFFERFPPVWVFYTFDVLMVVLLAMVILGIRTRLSLWLGFIILIVAESFHFSFGKIDHNILQLLSFPALACTNAGVKMAMVPDRPLSLRIQRVGLALYAIFICFGFFTAGFPKLISWIDFDLTTNGILSWYYKGFFSLERQRFLAPIVPNIPLLIMEVGDYFAVMLEISAFFFLIHSKQYWRFWLLMVCAFHLMNLLLLNITFIGNIAVYSLFLFVPLLNTLKVPPKVNKGLVWVTVPAAFIRILVIFDLLQIEVSVYMQETLALFMWLLMTIAGFVCVFFIRQIHLRLAGN